MEHSIKSMCLNLHAAYSLHPLSLKHTRTHANARDGHSNRRPQQQEEENTTEGERERESRESGLTKLAGLSATNNRSPNHGGKYQRTMRRFFSGAP